MRKFNKVLAVVLAVILSLSVCVLAVSAADARTYDEFTVANLLKNDNYTSYKYVQINENKMNQTMDVLTAFALYDSAWRNYATKEVNVADAEAILLGLIEKAEYSFNDGYVDEIVAVLDTAQSVDDFIQKVNTYANIELFASSGWSTAFEIIGDAAKIGHAYQTYRDEFIRRYAEVLSIQMANAYYIDMLQYIADAEEDGYKVLATAAKNLIAKMNYSVESVLADLAAEAAGDGADMAFDYLAKLALNTNVYTATALKVYQIGTSIANVLWNTGDLYTLIDTVKTAYYFQADLADYTAAALAGTDADKQLIALDMMCTARTISEQALYNYKLAENKGVITAIKNKLYNTVYNDTEMMILAVDGMRDILFGDTAPVVGALYVYGPATVSAQTAAVKSDVSRYSGETLTAIFVTDAAATATVTAAGKVTVAVVNAAGTKFASETANAGDVFALNTASGSYTFKGEVKELAAELVEETVKPTVSDVVTTTVEVGKDTVKQSSFAKAISDFFAKIAEFFTKLFKR